MNAEQWEEDILNSMEGSSRAKPDAALFSRILEQIDEAVVQKVPKIAVIATVLLICLINLTVFFFLWKYNNTDNMGSRLQASNETVLISNYNIYE